MGTLAYYAPWSNLCIFYQDFRFSEGLIPFGHIDEGMDVLSGMAGDFTLLMQDALTEPNAEAAIQKR